MVFCWCCVFIICPKLFVLSFCYIFYSFHIIVEKCLSWDKSQSRCFNWWVWILLNESERSLRLPLHSFHRNAFQHWRKCGKPFYFSWFWKNRIVSEKSMPVRPRLVNRPSQFYRWMRFNISYFFMISIRATKTNSGFDESKVFNRRIRANISSLLKFIRIVFRQVFFSYVSFETSNLGGFDYFGDEFV